MEARNSKPEIRIKCQGRMTNDRSAGVRFGHSSVFRFELRRYGSVEIMSPPMLAVGRMARAGVFFAGG
jgi:hypothetical protein